MSEKTGMKTTRSYMKSVMLTTQGREPPAPKEATRDASTNFPSLSSSSYGRLLPLPSTTGQASLAKQEFMSRGEQTLPITDVGCESKLTFKMKGTNIANMQAKVTSPSGRTETARVVDMSDCLYGVQFTPREDGVHTVNVRYKDIHIPGSPFQFTVGPLKEYGAHKVHAGGSGLERGIVKEPCEFNIWTREAGAGNLSLSIEGPSKAEIEFKDRKDGSCYVSYRVVEPGDYNVSIKFNDQQIPDSPFKVYVMPQVSDAKKIEVASLPSESSLHVNIPVTITVKKNGAKGDFDAKVVSPSGIEDDCFITTLDEDTTGIRFIPKENGVHAIHVRFNGIHVPQSPLKLRVGKDDADPGSVTAFGPGLSTTYAGVKTEFTINTSKAGHGNLSVTVDGPSKVTMDCTEVDEGYKVRYTPLLAGEYYITVKYNAYHISGSPFRVKCLPASALTDPLKEIKTTTVQQLTSLFSSRQSERESLETTKSREVKVTEVVVEDKSYPTRVTASGVGLSKAFVGKQNNFTVNCSNAGQSCLFASIFGPGGTCDLHLKHVGGNIYTVTYSVKEKGVYTLHVKWGDDPIPGSPFRVDAV